MILNPERSPCLLDAIRQGGIVRQTIRTERFDEHH
ncbi:UNVERIFIED_ORG: hypothetical protein J2811_007050 [Burkholderia cepacia]|jgi:hypothetical protein|nr:hypothetical protein [Burkholderia cepacia]PZW90735.1 hypothetical protein DFS13_1355 [Burkholderia sp. 28_3]RAS39889.1 hypothetical protein DFS07_1375 [Burkholderia cenocepacia]MDP9599555.1 hypothetical protein [Burkholderia cepacia]MDP9627567.1 hypothetical protein [Burkholderia cepacia]